MSDIYILYNIHNRPHADQHSLRNTFNQSLFELGMDVGYRKKLPAHASSLTTKIYTHHNFELAMHFINQVLSTNPTQLPKRKSIWYENVFFVGQLKSN